MNSNLKRLGIIAGIILGAFLLGYVTGQLALVTIIFKAIILILIAITILVTVHELGHFLAAKAFGIKVEVFSIGFPPRLFSFKRGETEYQIGATPLGGYVKIAGMIDESFDREVIDRQKAKEVAEKDGTVSHSYGPRSYEFRSKPVWQRLIVMLGGVIMNVILGITIFSTIKFMYGDAKIPMTEISSEGIVLWEDSLKGLDIDTISLGGILGFKTGDKILSFKGEEFTYMEDYKNPSNLIKDDAWFDLERNGQQMRLDIPASVQNLFSEDTIFQSLFTYKPTSHLFVHDKKIRQDNGMQISPAASTAGLKTGDTIIRLDSVDVTWFMDIKDYLTELTDEHSASSAARIVHVTFLREGDTLSTDVQLDENGYMGIEPYVEVIKYNLWGAIKAGTKEAFTFVADNAQGFKNATKKDVDANKSFMSIIQIAWRLVGVWEALGVPGILRFIGALSMILAFINILPIPALDGGHVVFLLIEGITRREPSVKVRLVAQQIGMLLILGLMLYFLFNDIVQMAS